MSRVLLRLVTIVLVMSLFAPMYQQSSAQSESTRPAALVSGTYRLVVQQTAMVSDPAAIGVTSNDPVIASIVDVTNLGVAAVFDPAIVSVGTFDTSPLELVTGTAANPDLSKQASIHAKLSIDGNFSIAENSSIRLILVFPIADASADSQLALKLVDQVVALEGTMVDTLDAGKVEALKPAMELRVADVTGAPGEGTLSVVFRDGGSQTIILSAVNTPKPGSASVPGCFFNESSAAILAMTGGTVWLEQEGDEYIAWINNPAMGTFDLLQARIVREGFGGANGSASSSYSAWLGTSTDWARGQNTGLWGECKSASGHWKVEPTPAPVPTKSPDEIRAEYQWVDARDLVIRPGTFEGEKIAVQGTVFNIRVEGNQTVMQILINGGDNDAVLIAYFGDSTGIYEGTWVTVYGTGRGTFTFTNRFGGQVSQPLIHADIVDK